MIWSEVLGGIAVILYLAIGFVVGAYVIKRGLLKEGLSEKGSDRWLEYLGVFFIAALIIFAWPALVLMTVCGMGLVKIMKIK